MKYSCSVDPVAVPIRIKPKLIVVLKLRCYYHMCEWARVGGCAATSSFFIYISTIALYSFVLIRHVFILICCNTRTKG